MTRSSLHSPVFSTQNKARLTGKYTVQEHADRVETSTVFLKPEAVLTYHVNTTAR